MNKITELGENSVFPRKSELEQVKTQELLHRNISDVLHLRQSQIIYYIVVLKVPIWKAITWILSGPRLERPLR